MASCASAARRFCPSPKARGRKAGTGAEAAAVEAGTIGAAVEAEAAVEAGTTGAAVGTGTTEAVAAVRRIV